MKALPIRFLVLIFVCLFSGRDRFHIAINQMDIFPQIMSKPWKWIHDVYTNYRFIIRIQRTFIEKHQTRADSDHIDNRSSQKE